MKESNFRNSVFEFVLEGTQDEEGVVVVDEKTTNILVKLRRSDLQKCQK